MMRTKTALTVIGATAALGAGGAIATDAAAFGVAANSASSSSVTAGPATKHIEGRIVTVSSQTRTFTVRDRERGTATLNVTARTGCRSAGIPNGGARSNDPVGHDVGDERGAEVAAHDHGDDRDGRRGPDDGAGHDHGDDHGDGHGRH